MDHAGRHYTTADEERRSYPAYLLRRSCRDEQDRPRKETPANLTDLPPGSIEALRATLKGRTLVDAEAEFEAARPVPHGDVAAADVMASRLGLRALLGPDVLQYPTVATMAAHLEGKDAPDSRAAAAHADRMERRRRAFRSRPRPGRPAATAPPGPSDRGRGLL